MDRPAADPPQLSGIIRTAFRLVERTERRRWLQLIPAGFVSAVLESVGALLILGLLSLLSNPENVQPIRVVQRVRELLPGLESRQFVLCYAAVVVTFFALKNGFRLFETRLRQRCVNLTAVDVSERLLRRYLDASYATLLTRNSATMMRNVREGTGSVQLVLNAATSAASELLVIAGVTVIVLLTTPLVALVTSAVAGLVAVGVLRWMQRRFSEWGQRRHETAGLIIRTLQEIFAGLKEIKIAGVENHFIAQYSQYRHRMAALDIKAETLRHVPQLTVETVFVAALVAASVLLMSVGPAANDNALVVLGFVGYALLRLLPTVHLFVYHLNECRYGGAAIASMAEDFALLDEHAGGRDRAPADGGEEGAFEFRTGIEFRGVGFRYAGASTSALSGISFSIRHGECIGVVGASGAGKSTLIDLLLGLLAPSEGALLVDGRDIRGNLRAWRTHIGYVAQDGFFIDDSIRHNVALGQPDAAISASRMADAIRMAQLDSLVTRLERGLDDEVGEGANRLSGGEKQRLATARALYRDPALLVFDEPTSALDAATERDWTNAIHALRGHKTIVIIAHRMSTLRDCDRLVMLEAGRLVDVDTYAALLHKHPAFRQLAETLEPARP